MKFQDLSKEQLQTVFENIYETLSVYIKAVNMAKQNSHYKVNIKMTDYLDIIYYNINLLKLMNINTEILNITNINEKKSCVDIDCSYKDLIEINTYKEFVKLFSPLVTEEYLNKLNCRSFEELIKEINL